MWSQLPDALAALAAAASRGQTWTAVLRKRKGDGRALLEELKHIYRLLSLVLDEQAAPESIIEDLPTGTYDRLALEGFNFDTLKRGRMTAYPDLAQSDLAPWGGKRTGDLVENIYDKIKDLKALHKYARERGKRRWRVRILNIQKRILLLLRHLAA
jgi:hypothetical protein